MDNNTVRILSLDGGGMRGYISATWLERFVELWGVNGKELWKYFDVITGTSIGGIMALAYSIGKSPTDILPFFTEDGPYIFTTDGSKPSRRPSVASKISTLVGSGTFYSSSTDGIGTKRLKAKLDTEFGNNTMQELKTLTVIPSFEKNDVETDFTQETNRPVYFSNSKIVPVLEGFNEKLVDVAMATSAAPLYFPAWDIGENSFIDGGIVQNNPASFGLRLARVLKPTAKRACVLSIGTGLGDVGFAEDDITPVMKKNNLTVLDGAKLIMYLVGAMNTASQEIVAKELEIESLYSLSDLHYYRSQYYLDPVKDTELDHSSPEILEYYRSSALEYFNKDHAQISAFLGHLTA